MQYRQAMRALSGLPGGRGLLAVALLHTITEFAAWVAVLIVAFEQGGASESGRAAAFQLIPAALAAPFVAAAGDRFPRDRVIQAAMLAIALSTGAIALVLATDGDIMVVYALAAMLCVALVATPTALASLFVHHARTPDDLTSLNVISSIVKSTGILLGPLVAALALAVATPTALFACLAAASTIGFVTVLRGLPGDDRVRSALRLRTVARDSYNGLRYAAMTTSIRRTLQFLFVSQLVLGALDVIMVAVAFDQLNLGASTAALLSSCLAAGAVAASIGATRFVGVVRITTLATAGGLLMTVPIAPLGSLSQLVAVGLALAIAGAGLALNDIGGLTLLQRVGSESMTSRVFGVFNSCALGAGALGAFITGALIDGLDLPTALSVIGAVSAVMIMVLAIRLRPVERQIPLVDPAELDVLRAVPFFAPLPLPTLERLVSTSTTRIHGPGEIVIAEGEKGHEFFVLTDGSVEIAVDGKPIRTTHAPDFFGEIALVRDIRRTATIMVVTPAEMVVIQRTAFLDAIALTASSTSTADRIVDIRRPDVAGFGWPQGRD